MEKTEYLKPIFPPGKEIHEFFGETKKSKKARADWCIENKKRKEYNKGLLKKKMTLIEQVEAGLR